MAADKYPSCITKGDQKRHWDVYARLRVITDWPGFADQQRERRQWLRDWLEKNTSCSKSVLDAAKPVNFCDLPQPKKDATKKGAQQEAAFIAEREVWWIYDDLGDKMQSFKSANRQWLEQRRKDVKGEHPDRFKWLSIATKHDPHWSDWKATHNTTTGAKKPAKESWRDKSKAWHESHLGITEQPAGSNCDNRADGIRASQDKCANGTWLRYQPWCGVWAFRGLLAAGKVKEGDSWLASVASIENYARQAKGPFRGWTSDGDKAKCGDLVVLFGRGVHVGTVRDVDANYCYTWEGNTSSGSGGSQSNGGGSFKRSRSRSGETYGYALVGCCTTNDQKTTRRARIRTRRPSRSARKDRTRRWTPTCWPRSRATTTTWGSPRPTGRNRSVSQPRRWTKGRGFGRALFSCVHGGSPTRWQGYRTGQAGGTVGPGTTTGDWAQCRARRQNGTAWDSR